MPWATRKTGTRPQTHTTTSAHPSCSYSDLRKNNAHKPQQEGATPLQSLPKETRGHSHSLRNANRSRSTQQPPHRSSLARFTTLFDHVGQQRGTTQLQRLSQATRDTPTASDTPNNNPTPSCTSNLSYVRFIKLKQHPQTTKKRCHTTSKVSQATRDTPTASDTLNNNPTPSCRSSLAMSGLSS